MRSGGAAMAALNPGDYARVLDAVRRLYQPLDLEAFPRAVNHLAAGLVDADRVGYTEINPARRRAIALLDTEQANAIMLEHLDAFERHMDQHPLLQHFQREPLAPPAKITDFMPIDRWLGSPLYTGFYHHLGLTHLMVVAVPTPPPLMVGVALGRGEADFDERDRQRLNLLRPHLAQAYRNAAILTDLHQAVADSEGAFAALSMGLIALDGQLRVQRLTAMAQQALHEMFDHQQLPGRALPLRLLRWARRQIAALNQSENKGYAPAPLILARADERLTLRLMCLAQPRRYLIHLSRQSARGAAAVLEKLGLSRREAQVLLLVREGLTNPQIASRLSVSRETVNRHLDTVYRKLGVGNRVSAAVLATECLRGM